MPFVKPNKNIHQYIVGIDFGHGETSVAIAQIDWSSSYDKLGKPVDVEFDGRSSMFSCFAQSKSDKSIIYIGNSAHKYAHLIDSVTNDYKWDFYAYFKDTPSKLREAGQLDVMKTFMRSVYEKVLILKGNDGGLLTKDNHLVYIACPSSSQDWTESEVEAYAKLASEAGIPLCSIDGFTNGIIRESRAAFICARNQPNMPVSDGILIVDFGSSTVDFTYYSSQESKPIDDGMRIGDDGNELGAQRIEELILDDISKSSADVKALCKSNRIKDSLLLSIRQVKENFYNGESASDLVVNLNLQSLTGRPNAPKVSQFYSPDEIEAMGEMRKYQASIRNAFVKFKSNHLSGKVVRSIFLTGGASRMSWVKDIATSVFDDKVKFPQEIGDSSTTISRGIALAGRADVRTILLETSLSSITPIPNDFADKIIKDAAKKFSVDAFETIKSEVVDFKNASTNHSIATLKVWVKDALNRMSLDKAVLKSYDSLTRERISNVLLPKVNDLIHEYASRNVSIELPKTQTLSGHKLTSMSFAVNKVADVCFEEVKDELPTKFLKSVVNVLSSAVTTTVNVGKLLVNAASQVVAGENVVEYTDPEDYWVEFTKPTTHLDSGQRKRVYDAFMAAEMSIKNRIEIEIIYGNKEIVKKQIVEAYQKDIKSFIDSSIKEARLMLD